MRNLIKLWRLIPTCALPCLVTVSKVRAYESETNKDASKFLSNSRAAPLFEGASLGFDPDTETFLGGVGESLASSNASISEDDPPDDIAIESAHHSVDSSRIKYPNWAQSTRVWRGAMKPPQEQDEGGSEDEGAQDYVQQPERASSVPPAIERRPLLGRLPANHIQMVVTAVYLVATALSLATAALVYLTTSPTSTTGVYPILARSAGHLIAYALVSVVVAAGWLVAMQHHAREMIQISTFGVPIILGFVSLYGLLFSFHSATGHGYVHMALRLTALGIGGLAVGWTIVLQRSRHLVGKATEMVILAVELANSQPVVYGVAAVVGGLSLVITGLWGVLLARGFLEGRLSVLFALGFTFLYLWTWELLCCLQKCVVVGMAAHWYHQAPRPSSPHQSPTPPPAAPRMASRDAMETAVFNAFTVHFGSCCLAALLKVFGRLPLLIVPSRVGAALQAMAATAGQLAALPLLDSLALSAAVVLPGTLATGASAVTLPCFAATDRQAHRVARLLLSAARSCAALLVAIVAWTYADRTAVPSSVYGYLVGFIGFWVGWTIVGAADNTLGMTLDGLLVVYALDGMPKRRLDVERIFAAADGLV